MAGVALPPVQAPVSAPNGSFDANFYAYLKSLQQRVAALEASNAALLADNAVLRTALNQVRQNPTTVYPAI